MITKDLQEARDFPEEAQDFIDAMKLASAAMIMFSRSAKAAGLDKGQCSLAMLDIALTNMISAYTPDQIEENIGTVMEMVRDFLVRDIEIALEVETEIKDAKETMQ